MNIRKGFLKFTLGLSIFVGVFTSVGHELFFDRSGIDVTLPENWQRMSTQEKLDGLGGLLLKDAPFSLLSEIKQFKIRSRLKKMIREEEDRVLRDRFNYSFGFRFYLGWEELTLLGLAGFTSIWILCIVGRVIILLIPSVRTVHFLSLPSSGRIESLDFHVSCKPALPPSVKITLFRFLVLEESPKRPGKPGAAWID